MRQMNAVGRLEMGLEVSEKEEEGVRSFRACHDKRSSSRKRVRKRFIYVYSTPLLTGIER